MINKENQNNNINKTVNDNYTVNNEFESDLYISNPLNINGYSIYLLNNECEEKFNLIVEDKNNLSIFHQHPIPVKSNEMDETNKKVFESILDIYTNNKGNENFTDLYLNLLENKHDENTVYINNTELIELIEKEKQHIINHKKTEEEKEQNHISQSLKSNISLILNKVKGEENPLNLNRSDLSEYIAKYLSHEYGLILRSNVNTPHLLNTENNCYELTDPETILKILANDFGHNTISMKETLKALDFIDDRRKPTYNIIRFDNCIYDMETHEIIKLDEPLLPYFDIYFNYNPNAKGELIQQFLYSSLNEKQVKGLLELIGYLFTVENKENIVLCFIGKGGSGKSVLSNILTHLFKRVSNLPIHNLNKDHELSILENKLLNICNDTDNKKIKDNGTFKQITGGDSVHINPKYRTPYDMPPQEVPYFIIVGNQFPQFEKLEIPIIERLMLVEFKKGFRNTKEQNKNLYDDIIRNNDNIEWLIYNSLKAYKEMAINNRDFTLRKSTTENLDLYNKHTNPLKWIVKKLIEFNDIYLLNIDINENSLNNYTDYISADDLKQKIITYADLQGLDITNENNSISTNKLTNTIKSAFNLWSLNDNYGYDYKPLRKQEHNTRINIYPNIKYKDNSKE